MSSNDLPNPGHPEGAGGKDTGTFTQLGDELLSDEYASRVASSLARSNNKRVNLHDRDAVEAENITQAERNLNRANKRMDDNHIKDVSDDEPFLDESNPPENAPSAKPSVPSFITDTVDYIGSLTPTTKSILATLSAKGQVLPGGNQAVTSSTGTTPDAPVFTEANTRIVDSEVTAFEIPRVLLNLA